MPFFAQTRLRRRTAIAVLWAWVFALLVGIANACAPAAPEASHARSEHRATLAGHDHAAGAPIAPEPDGDADGSRALKPPCQKFCDDEATTVVKHAEAVKAVPMAYATISVQCMPACANAPIQVRRCAPPPPEAPVAIRFLRLTI